MGRGGSRRSDVATRLIPIASSLYTLHEGRQVREEGIGGGKLLRALCDLGVKALGFWFETFHEGPAPSVVLGNELVRKVCHPECNEGSISAWPASSIKLDPSLRSG